MATLSGRNTRSSCSGFCPRNRTCSGWALAYCTHQRRSTSSTSSVRISMTTTSSSRSLTPRGRSPAKTRLSTPKRVGTAAAALTVWFAMPLFFAHSQTALSGVSGLKMTHREA
eukprot:2393284-Rhodomonas_salina.1